MDCFPYEILEITCDYLNLKDTLSFLQVSKKINQKLDIKSFWSHRFILFFPTMIPKRSKNYKISYIKTFMMFCFVCGTKTTCKDPFTWHTVCITCQTNNLKYICVCYTDAQKVFKLSDSDLSSIPCVEKRNPYRRSMSMWLYRLQDIMEFAISKHSTKTT
jgi:F-box associated protein